MRFGEDVFILRIALGNDAMQTGDDLAGALRKLAERVEGQHNAANLTGGYGAVKDVNGNNVGEWEIQ